MKTVVRQLNIQIYSSGQKCGWTLRFESHWQIVFKAVGVDESEKE